MKPVLPHRNDGGYWLLARGVFEMSSIIPGKQTHYAQVGDSTSNLLPRPKIQNKVKMLHNSSSGDCIGKMCIDFVVAVKFRDIGGCRILYYKKSSF